VAFAESRKCFGELEDWMASEEAAGLQHAELEDQLEVLGQAGCPTPEWGSPPSAHRIGKTAGALRSPILPIPFVVGY
jgi:hypothetical protein